MTDKIKKLAESLGVCDIGFSAVNPSGEYPDLTNSISIVIRLSDAVVDSIDNAPTHTYFHHYRSVNALIDHITLRIGLLLAENGYRYVCVPASQSIEGMKGLMSHKYAAINAGLGTIGKNALFLSRKFGARVRLGTILTNCDLSAEYGKPIETNLCSGCNTCVNACPAMALTGNKFDMNHPEIPVVDAFACSKYMKEKFQRIGRGAVCGICMRVCPVRSLK